MPVVVKMLDCKGVRLCLLGRENTSQSVATLALFLSRVFRGPFSGCLLYTSDAADE